MSTVEIFESKGWPNRALDRKDDFDALADHLKRDGFRASVTNFADLVVMLGYLPTREPFLFDAPRWGEAGIWIGRVGDTPFKLDNGEYTREGVADSWMRTGVLWKRSITDDRREWLEADEAEKIFRDFVQLYKDGVVSMSDDIFMPKSHSLVPVIVEKIVEILEEKNTSDS